VSGFFQTEKNWFPSLMKRMSERKKKIAGLCSSCPGETIDDICHEHSQAYSKQSEDLKRQFASIAV
jgi:hypothetical protein